MVITVLAGLDSFLVLDERLKLYEHGAKRARAALTFLKMGGR